MKKALVTICIGEEFKRLAEITHTSIKSYADRIKADFIIINEPFIPEQEQETPHWKKFEIKNILNLYDRVIYLDSDIIIREDCPDLFDIVPYNQIGAFNEAKFVSRELSMIETAKAYNIDTTRMNWNGKYYNTGVMVISKCHKDILTRPELIYSNYYEQSYINLKIAMEESTRTEEDAPLMYELSYIYNRMTCLDFCGEVRHASYIIHYAGYHYFTKPGEIHDLIKFDLDTWEKDKPNYSYKRKIVTVVSGGMGDQVDAEPTLRALKEIYKGTADIIITTHWPRLFEHLGYPVIKHSDFDARAYAPYYEMKTFPDPSTVTYSVISNLLCHTVDYCSIATLQRTLPLKDRIIKIPTKIEDEKELDSILNGFDLKKAIVLHPGRHWDSKTFPQEWWQDIVNKVSKEAPICLIGTDYHDNRGAYQLELPGNSINLIDRTSVGVLISVISRAPILVSNDSAPIHIAGSFDNWVVVIPTCKHPDHILPYRMGEKGEVSNYHKAIALYKKLTLDDCDQRPTTWIDGGVTAETKKDPWENYIPTSEEVAQKIFTIYKNIL